MQRAPSARSAPLPWDDIQLFLALCRARTLGGAARALGVDGSTVSRRLSALELRLGKLLFDRGRDGVTPLGAAEELMPLAEETEAAVDRFENAVDGLERDVSGLVRITCPPDTAEVIVVPLLRELLKRHPALRLAVDPGEAVLDLARREADLALRVARPVSGDLLVTRLRRVRWVVAAAPETAQRLGRLTEWSAAPWIGWGERFAHGRPAQWLARHAGDSEPVMTSDSLTVQLAAVREGLGLALLPEPSLEHYGLVPVRFASRLRESASLWPVDDLFLVSHRALRNVPRVRAVWELLVARLADRSRSDSSA